MVRICVLTALLVLPTLSLASDNAKVEKYLIQVVGLRTDAFLEFEKVEAQFDSGVSDLKSTFEPKFKKQLDQSFTDGNLDSVIEIKAGIKEFGNYQPDLADELTRMKFQNGTVKEFFYQLQILRSQSSAELNRIESEFDTNAKQLHDKLLSELRSDFADAMSKKDLNSAIKIRELIKSVNIPTLFLALKNPDEISRNALTLKGHTGIVSCVAFSPDGNSIISGSWDETIKIWDSKSGKEMMTLNGHTSQVTSVAFSLDGNSIASGSKTGVLKVWNSQTGKEKFTYRVLAGVASLAFHPNEGKILVGDYRGTLQMVDFATGKRVRTFIRLSDACIRGTFSPDGNSVASGSDDGTLRVWDVETGKENLTLNKRRGPINCVRFSPSGDSIVIGIGKTPDIWNAKTGKEKLTLKTVPPTGHPSPVTSAIFSPDGSTIVSLSLGHFVPFSVRTPPILKVWNATSGKEILSFNIHRSAVNSIAFSPDGNSIVTGSSDETLKIWNLKGDISH